MCNISGGSNSLNIEIITYTKEVICSLVFICLLAGLHELLSTKCIEFGGIYGPWKKLLDFGGNQVHVTLGVIVMVGFGYVRWGGGTAILCMGVYLVTSATLAEVYDLLSAILVNLVNIQECFLTLFTKIKGLFQFNLSTHFSEHVWQ